MGQYGYTASEMGDIGSFTSSTQAAPAAFRGSSRSWSAVSLRGRDVELASVLDYHGRTSLLPGRNPAAVSLAELVDEAMAFAAGAIAERLAGHLAALVLGPDRSPG